MKYRKKILTVKTSRKWKAIEDAKAQTGLHNRHGGGRLLPSEFGWGQHKIDKRRITLPKIGGDYAGSNHQP